MHTPPEGVPVRRTQTPVLRWVPLVVVGGAAGTALRAGLGGAFPVPATGVPWTTLAINVGGSFLLGLLIETLAAGDPDRGWRRTVRLTVGTGVLGGFTTYSTVMLETAERLRDGQAIVAIGYLVVTVLLGVGAAFAGMALASSHARRRREERR